MELALPAVPAAVAQRLYYRFREGEMKPVKVTLKPEEIEEPTDLDLANAMLAGATEKVGVTLADIKTRRGPLDVRKIKAKVLGSYTCREWEPGDLINGIDPREHPNEVIRNEVNRHLDAGGKILLVYERDEYGDERLVYFQYHEPYTSQGPIMDIGKTANKMVRRQAGHKLADSLAEEVRIKL